MSLQALHSFGNCSFQAACRLANQVPMDRFPAFLERITAAVAKDERTFSDFEEAKLTQVMGLSEENLQILIFACTLIFEKAAFHSSTVSNLSTVLSQAGLSAAPIAAFQDVWRLGGPGLISALKERSLGAPGHNRLVDIQWRIHLQVASGSFNQSCEPSAVLQLGLASHDKEKECEITRNLVLKLSNDELYGLYEKLEHIQEQIDQLS